MKTALYVLCIVVYIITASDARKNTWFKISNTNLPLPLYGHSIGIYNETITVIGGIDTKHVFSTHIFSAQLYPYIIYNYTNILLNNNNDLSSWKSISNQIDHRYFSGFKCKGQCYTYINKYIYIINPESQFYDESGDLVIYDMENSQFIDYRLFNHTLIYTEAGICATNNNTHIFAIGSKCLNCTTTAYNDIQIYEINTNGPWYIGGYMNLGRYYSGCSIDTSNQNLYIFGGYINHNINNDAGDVSNHIEKCDLIHGNEIICQNITNTQLNIARAEHQTIITRNNLIFIIGGYDNTNKLTEIVEIFDISTEVVFNNEWFTYINNGITQFGLFYDDKFDVIYTIGGINNVNITTNVLYYSVCLLYDNCYPTIDENPINILDCDTNINIHISNPHDLHSYYFNITSNDKLISFSFNNCMSSIDTYVYLFIWNETLNQWHNGYLNHDWHWDDNGCNNINNNFFQESFTVNYPQNGFYHLVLSAHENGNYSAQFQCILEPTTHPSVNPTITPTIEPTINPTINPTIIPSINPSIYPSIYPTIAPTEMIIFESTISKSEDYKKIWFVLSFICESYEDLLTMDWESLILNGLLNVFKPDLRFILHTTIDIENIINSNSNKRQLLGATKNEIFYYDIESNVTIDILYLNGNNISYLCRPIFSFNFIDGLSQQTHINRAQIYKLGKCNENLLPKTWDINVKHTHPRSDILPIIILLFISISVIFIGYVTQQLRRIDSLNMYKLLLFAIYLLNAYSDVFFAIFIWIYIVTDDSFIDISFIIIGIISVCVIVIPFIKSIYDINIFFKYWKSNSTHGGMITDWVNEYGKAVYFVSFMSFSPHGSMELVNSNLFGIRLFSMGLPPHLQQRFSKQRLWVILLGNIPQLIIQTILLFFFDPIEYGIFALVTSILSIITYFCNLYMSFNYNNSACQSTLFSWRISSVTIAKKANYFRNKYLIVNKYISKTLNVNPLNERFDMLPPIQYYDSNDTDIGGLNFYLLVTTNLSNKDTTVYSTKLKTIIQNNSLSKQIQILWDLPLKEEINIYRFKGIKNTSVNSMQMASIIHAHTQFGLSRHMKINSASTQIPTHNYDNDNSDSSNSHQIEIKQKHNKNNKDFIAVNNNDDNETFVEDKNAQNVIHGNEQYEYGFTFNSTTNEDLL